MVIYSSDQQQKSSTQRLIYIWEKRYVPDLSSLPERENMYSFRQRLAMLLTPEGRRESSSKLTQRAVAIKCQMASLQTQSLYSYIPNVVSLSEAQRLADVVLEVYLELAEIYQCPYYKYIAKKDEVDIVKILQKDDSALAYLPINAWGIPSVEILAKALEPVLVEFCSQHAISSDWRTKGFLTTLLNFSNELILKNLSPEEKFLLLPYFQFAEEQVAIPWQQVCVEAERYSVDDPIFAIVERCLPQAQVIAHQVYRQLRRCLSHHKSRRGHLHEPGIAHSIIRDLQMIQAYFWLSFLQQSPSVIRDKLVPLFIMVNSAIEVSWDFVEQANRLLVEQILAHLTPEQAVLVRPHANHYIQAFVQRRAEFKDGELGQVKHELRSFALGSLGSHSQFEPPAKTAEIRPDIPDKYSSDSEVSDSEVADLKATLAALEATLSRSSKST